MSVPELAGVTDEPGIDLADMRLLVVLSEELHFGRAAARLHLSQPGLSYRVQRLEETLGYQVVTRGRRGISLTAGGAQLLEGAGRLLAEARRVVDDAARVANGEFATLRVGVAGTALYSLVPAALRRLRRDHPEVRLVLAESKTTAQVAALGAGTLDVGIMHLPLPGETGLRTRTLRRDPVGLALPADWEIGGDGPVPLASLADRPFVLFPRAVEPVTYDRYVAACVDAGFAPGIVQEATGLQTILSLVAGGVGAAFVAEPVAAALTRAGVVFRPIAGGLPVLETGAAWRADAPPAVRMLVETLTAASHDPGWA